MTARPGRPTRGPAEGTDTSDLTGQCALVTGSTRGIGRGIAQLLAAHGARVIVHGRNRDTVEEVRREIEALGGTAMGVLAELTSTEAVQHLHDEVTTAWGTPDVVVANAGGSPVRPERRGIGRALVQTLAAEAAAAGCEWLHVDYEPHLDVFYRRACGFRATDAGLLNLSR